MAKEARKPDVTLAGLHTYLLTQDPEKSFGISADGNNCPLAIYMRKQKFYNVIVSGYYKTASWIKDHQTHSVPLSAPSYTFMCTIDSSFNYKTKLKVRDVLPIVEKLLG